MGVPEITAALTGTNQAMKAIAGILSTVRDVDGKEAVSKLQDQILDLQAKLFSIQSQYEQLAEEKRQAEEKVKAHEKWDAEAGRYRLSEIVPGILVYSLKPDASKGEPMHWLCPHCFQDQKKSILGKPVAGYDNYKCQGCGFQIIPVQPQRNLGGGWE